LGCHWCHSYVKPSPSRFRPSRTPRWKPEKRLRTRSALRVGTCLKFSGLGAVPGTRFALGTRFGNPEVVSPPASGSAAVRAAFHPRSAAEFHSCSEPDAETLLPGAVLRDCCGACEGSTCWMGPVSVASTVGPPVRRLNQFDSIASKIGSESALTPSGVGGTTVPPVP